MLILVQRRSDLFTEIIAACKAKQLPIAGKDRLKVAAELAVKDLMALLRFLATPADDLSLAEALKSPIFGWNEQQLFSLAHHRPPGCSWGRHSGTGPTATAGLLIFWKICATKQIIYGPMSYWSAF